MAAWAGLAEDRRSSATCVIILLYTRKFVSRKTPWAAELMQDKPINKATMKRIFLLFSLLLGVLSAWAYDVELDGIFYNLDKENKTASVASYSYKGAVVIPETISVDGKAYTVTSLGEYCFSGCWGLTSITIPNSVTRIGEYCFSSCGGLESIVVESGNTVYDSRENCNAIIETATNTMLSGCRNTTIPNSVTSLGDGCFSGCSGLTSITIPSSVTSLGEYCFSDCSGLTSITIPNSVTSLGGYCFDCCLGLTEVHANRETPPATGYDIFHTCISLQTIYVPTGASANYDIAPWNAYKIVEEEVQSGITAVTVEGETAAPVYHLNGSRAGTMKNFSAQPKGIYIVKGKKVLR